MLRGKKNKKTLFIHSDGNCTIVDGGKQTIQIKVHWIHAMAAGKLTESLKNIVFSIIMLHLAYKDYYHHNFTFSNLKILLNCQCSEKHPATEHELESVGLVI